MASDVVKYHPRNQLDQVICQVTFAPVLKINTDEILASFQKMMGADYPQYSSNKIIPSGPPVNAIVPGEVSHYFKSQNGFETVSLSISALSLTVLRYSNWQDYSAQVEKLIKALGKVCGVHTFARVGLRYINAIRRSSLAMDGCSWDELIAKPYVSLFVNSAAGELVGGGVNLQYNLGEAVNMRSSFGLIVFNESGEQGFLIDNDVFTEKNVDSAEIKASLDDFHRRSENMFRKMTSSALQKKVGLNDC